MELGKIQNGISYKKIILGFLFFSLAFIGLIFHFTFSQAEIVLYPKEIQKTVSFKVKIDKNIKTPNASRNILPGTILEIVKTGSKTFKTESVAQVDDFAKGEITIYNKREKDQPLYQKSKIAPLGKKSPVFLIDKRVVIPAKGEIKVGITAREKGADGNIESTKLNFLKLSSWMRQRIWAESFAATKGGTKEAKIVLEKDIKNAEKKLAEELWQKSFKEIEKKIKKNEQIIPQLVKNEIIKTKCDTKPDAIKENFSVKVETKTRSAGVSEKILLSLAKMRLKKEGAADEEFKNYLEETFNYKLTKINIEEGWARLEVNIDGTFIPKFSAKIFDKEKIIGMSKEEVKKYFKDFETIEKIEVNFWPSWVKNIPGLKKNIMIEIKN